LLFAGYSAADVAKVFVIDKAMDGVACRIRAGYLFDVGGGAMQEVIGYAYV